MLENAPSDPSIKRYTPPPRNRLLNRRTSGEKLDRMNSSQGNDGDKSSSTLRNVPAVTYGDSSSSNYQRENSYPALIVMGGCSSSQAAQLMIDRWTSAMASYNDPSIGISEKPIIYSGSSGSAWGSVKLPHQMDFLMELRHSIQAANGHINAGDIMPKLKASVPGRT